MMRAVPSAEPLTKRRPSVSLAAPATRAPGAPRLLKYKSVEGEGAAPEGFEL